MARVTLIKPSIFISSRSISPVNGLPSLSLAYLTGALRAAKHEVTCIDGLGEGLLRFRSVAGTRHLLHGLSFEEILERVPPDAQLIGVSLMFSNEWPSYKELLFKLRSRFPRVPLVVGGEHATAQFEFIFKSTPFVDACAIGEGEATLVAVADAVAQGLPLDHIPGLALRRDGRVFKTTARPRIMDLSTIPDPDWSTLPVKEFMDRGLGLSVQNRRAIPMLASRGCPFQCTFCSSPGMWGTRLQSRSPREVVDEIRAHVERYQIEHVDFCDLVGVVNRGWLEEFCNRLIEENLGISWVLGAGTRSEILDPTMLELMKRSNILRIQYAPETGSEETVKRINKRVSLTKLAGSMRYAARIGITTRANIIFGFPGQRKRELFKSILFSWRLAAFGTDDVVFVPFAPYPGSALHAELVKSGDVPDFRKIGTIEYEKFLSENIFTDPFAIRSYSEYFSSTYLTFSLFFSIGAFYFVQFALRPHRLIRSFKRAFYTKRPQTFFESLIYTFFIDRILGRKMALEQIRVEFAFTDTTDPRQVAQPCEATI